MLVELITSTLLSASIRTSSPRTPLPSNNIFIPDVDLKISVFFEEREKASEAVILAGTWKGAGAILQTGKLSHSKARWLISD